MQQSIFTWERERKEGREGGKKKEMQRSIFSFWQEQTYDGLRITKSQKDPNVLI